jgi:hypothetical protein
VPISSCHQFSLLLFSVGFCWFLLSCGPRVKLSLWLCSSVLATSPRWLIWFQFSLPADFSASVEAPATCLHVVTCPTFPGLSSQGPPAVFSPARQFFGQVFIFVARNFVDAQVLVPASFSRSTPRQHRSVLQSSSIPHVKTTVFAACVSPPLATARLGCQLRASACPGCPLGGPSVRSGARA